MKPVIKSNSLSPEVKRKVIRAQINEVTEYHIYKHLSRVVQDGSNKAVLSRIADEELEHYRFWMQFNDEVEPRWWEVKIYILLYKIFGLVFSLKLMEKAEAAAQREYTGLAGHIPGVAGIIEDETRHEKSLINMINDHRIKGFGTLLISLNMILYVSAGLAIVLPVTVSPDVAGFLLLVSIVLVSAADFANTLIMRSSDKFSKEMLYRSLRRMFFGFFTGFLLFLPYLFWGSDMLTWIVSGGIIVLLSMFLNTFHAIISDLPVFNRLVRTFLSFFLIIAFTAVMLAGLSLVPES